MSPCVHGAALYQRVLQTENGKKLSNVSLGENGLRFNHVALKLLYPVLIKSEPPSLITFISVVRYKIHVSNR